MPITSVPTYDPQNPFYNPNFGYNNPNGSAWSDDQLNLGYQIGEQDKSSAWTRKLAMMGHGGTSNQDMFLRSQLGRAQEGYGAAQMDAPGITWQDYLKGLDLNRILADSSPTARGDRQNLITPNVRWARRP